MTPDQDRDKINMMFEDTGVGRRAANILDAAVLQLQARLCYTKAEALAAARKHFGVKRKRQTGAEADA
jgi:hypothetical protein